MAWVSPTGFNDPSGEWINEANAYDEDTGTCTYNDADGSTPTGWLELTHAALDCDKVKIWAKKGTTVCGGGSAFLADVDVYYSGAWHNIVDRESSFTAGKEVLIGSIQSVTKVRIREVALTRGNFNYCNVFEVDFWEIPSIVAPTVTTQAATNVQATTARLNGQISDDGEEACQYRFRYKKSGGGYSYTSWTGAKTTGQTFYENISGLDRKSLYYFNAQAKNSAGESAWGGELSFTTLATIPVVTTQAVTDIGFD